MQATFLQNYNQVIKDNTVHNQKITADWFKLVTDMGKATAAEEKGRINIQ